jgi:pyroglutamyl-peptidase
MKKLLLTGFGPFADFKSNPSQDVVLELNGEVINNFNVIGKILPVSYKKAGASLINFIQNETPDAIISLGLAASRTKITPELIAINYIHSLRPDNDGVQKLNQKIDYSGENAYFTTLPIEIMLEQLNKLQIPSELSSTAGTYVCNLTKYHLLHYLNMQKSSIPAGFIHVPACLEQSILFDGIRACIKCLP